MDIYFLFIIKYQNKDLLLKVFGHYNTEKREQYLFSLCIWRKCDSDIKL